MNVSDRMKERQSKNFVSVLLGRNSIIIWQNEIELEK